MPLVFYAEGGGGPSRRYDRWPTGLDGPSFVQFAKLRLVPVIGVVSGYCFQGNAAMLGCCDSSSHQECVDRHGRSAMIEGGGLGVYHPAGSGRCRSSRPRRDRTSSSRTRRRQLQSPQKYLSYFQACRRGLESAGPAPACGGRSGDRAAGLRHPLRDRWVADEGSVLEIRRDFGVGMITAFIRIEAKPFG